MDIRYKRSNLNTNLILSVCALLVGAAGFVALSTMDLRGGGSLLRGGSMGMTIAGAVLMIGTIAQMRQTAALLSIGPDGLTFGHPKVGLIPWSQFDRMEIWAPFMQKNLAIFVRPPAGDPGFLAPTMTGLARRAKGGLLRYTLPLGRLDKSLDEIRAEVAKYAA